MICGLFKILAPAGFRGFIFFLHLEGSTNKKKKNARETLFRRTS